MLSRPTSERRWSPPPGRESMAPNASPCVRQPTNTGDAFPFRRPAVARRKHIAKLIEELMTAKAAVLTKAQTLTAVGMPETTQALWVSAASYEERIAALLDAHGDDLEAAV